VCCGMRWREELTRRFPKLTTLPPESYVVGGAIRDLLLGREPLDVDVASRAPLEAAKRVRTRVIRLGSEEHLSAWRVVDDGHVYDFAAIEGPDITTDLARRDFTVNAMAVDLERDTLLDPHEGQSDIAARLVRMVNAGNFDDDPLRILKGVRMAVRYGFEIEPETLRAIRERADSITQIAPERVTYELSIILGSGSLRKALVLLSSTGLGRALGLRDVAVAEDEVPLSAAYALLVEQPQEYAKRWRWSEMLQREVLLLQRLLEHHDRMALFDAGETVARQLPPLLRALGRDEFVDFPDFTIRPLLDGNELATLLSIAPGKELGRILRMLLEEQVSGGVKTREEAEAFALAAARCQ
jgi:tRNA nucleotidyltransferase/poly(A) polymerase